MHRPASKLSARGATRRGTADQEDEIRLQNPILDQKILEINEPTNDRVEVALFAVRQVRVEQEVELVEDRPVAGPLVLDDEVTPDEIEDLARPDRLRGIDPDQLFDGGAAERHPMSTQE